jgi:exodeoxyribonuclease V alpha subunit
VLSRREEWGLALCRTPGDKPRQARVGGPLSAFDGGDRVQVVGTWQSHPKYGLTLQARKAERLGVDERGAVVDVLRSVRHLGPRKAEELVDKYGVDGVFAEIDKDPQKTFVKLPGLGLVKGREAAAAWTKATPARPLHLLLARQRIGWLTPRLVKAYGASQALERMTADPYSLTSLHGIGVRTADKIAQEVGIDPHGEQRARAVLLEVLREAGMRGGHVGLPPERAREAALALSLEPAVALPDELTELVDGDSLVLEAGLLADGVVRRREQAVAAGLVRLAGSPPNAKLAGVKVPDPLEVSGKSLDGEQRAAVLAALQHPVSVATGLPGTGKTVLIEALAELGTAVLGEDGVLLAAPTGRAARRIEEATGHDASTIHRMLGWIPGQPAERGEDEPLEAGLVVVDEASMLSLDVLEVLLAAIPTGCHLVFVGDVDQLEPVGAGKPLADLIDADVVPVGRLRTIKRQSQRSMIVHAAHAINRGEGPEFGLEALQERLAAGLDGATERPELERDIFWIPRSGQEAIADEVVELVCDRLPKFTGVDPISGQQVLAPIYRGPCGVIELGQRIRTRLLEGQPPVGSTGFFVGDKLIATANDYETGLVNGQVLRVRGPVGKGGLLVAQEDGEEIPLPKESLPLLEPAFAMTVHKAQGTEVPVLVLPITSGHRFLLDRKLLYTAVTRAKRLCVLVGERDTLLAAAAGTGREARITRLRELLTA